MCFVEANLYNETCLDDPATGDDLTIAKSRSNTFHTHGMSLAPWPAPKVGFTLRGRPVFMRTITAGGLDLKANRTGPRDLSDSWGSRFQRTCRVGLVSSGQLHARRCGWRAHFLDEACEASVWESRLCG